MSERILLVESDPDIVELIARQALKPLGYNVKVVDHAAQAIEDALKNPPDLIIANLDLPDLGGKDVLAALSSQGVSAPLVVIAEKGDERRAIQAFRLGAADALLLPAKDAEVVRVVERAIQPTRSRRIRRELYQQLEALRDELKRRARGVASLLTMTRAVSSSMEQRQLLGRLLESAIQIADADIAWLMVRQEQTGEYLLRAQRNLPAGWAKKLNQTLDDGLSSLVAVSGQTLIIHGRPLEKFRAAALGKSAAVVPVKVRNEVLAVLVLIRKQSVEVDKDSQTLLEAIADLTSISLLNAQLFMALESAGRASRNNQKDRVAFREVLQGLVDRLSAMESGDAGELTKSQRQTLGAMKASMHRLINPAGKRIGSDPSRE